MTKRKLTAWECYQTARATGAEFLAGGDVLLAKGAERAPLKCLLSLYRNQAEIGRSIRPADEADTDELWSLHLDYSEAMAERSGASWEKARGVGVEWCIGEWIRCNPAPGTPHTCAHCGRGDLPGDRVCLDEFVADDLAWTHSKCLLPRSTARRAEAVAALAKRGLIEAATIDLHLEIPSALMALRINQRTKWSTLEDCLRQSLAAKAAAKRKAPAKRPRW